MFTDRDYKNYLHTVENAFRDQITKVTDLLNDLSNESVRSKLDAISQDDLEGFRICKGYRNRFNEK